MNFQYIGIIGLHCALHLLKSEAPPVRCFVRLFLDQKVSECVHSRVDFGRVQYSVIGRVQYSVIGRGVTCLRE